LHDKATLSTGAADCRCRTRSRGRTLLAPVVVAELAASIRRLIADEGMAIVLIEQHARFALENTQSAIVLERGRVVHRGSSAELAADEPRLDRLIGMRRLHQPPTETESTP
jgi:ABC-type glutathione transport system ATPase component